MRLKRRIFARFTYSQFATALLVATLTVIASCGDDKHDQDKGSNAADAEGAPAAQTADRVKACGVNDGAALGFNLAGETYASSIVPITVGKCVRCHAGDPQMQNSTTCGYLEKNIDAVLVRVNNSILAEAQLVIENAKVDGDTTKLSANQIQNSYPAGQRPMPPTGQQANRRITTPEIDIFTSWRDVPNKCQDLSTADGALGEVLNYTDADEELARKAKIFQAEGCEDGPAVASDRAYVENILALPADSPSAYYDYAAKAFVAGARKMDGNCTIDYFITALGVVPGASDVLKEYKAYGWWTTQCAVIDGRPQAYLAHVARVTTALGDRTYGVFLKPLKITDK